MNFRATPVEQDAKDDQGDGYDCLFHMAQGLDVKFKEPCNTDIHVNGFGGTTASLLMAAVKRSK